MGCLSSKPAARDKYLAQDDERVTALKPSSSRRGSKEAGRSPRCSTEAKAQIPSYKPKKLDPKDFKFVGLRSGVHVKAPGSINGQAFTIDDCKDCDLFVLDRTAQVNIDGCTNCRIFIGPTAGSIFLRDSSNVKCAFITRQLRLRTVLDSDIALLCRTQPILEESSNIGLTCYYLDYPALAGQLQGAKLDMLHNFWWHVYDFTPKLGNWKPLPAGPTASLLGGLPEEVTTALGITTAQADSNQQGGLVLSVGPQVSPSPASGPDYLCAIFPPNAEAAARTFIQEAQAEPDVRLVSTNQAALSPELRDVCKAKAGWPGSAEQALTAPGECVGVELLGPGVAQRLAPRVQQAGGHPTSCVEVGSLFRTLGLQGSG